MDAPTAPKTAPAKPKVGKPKKPSTKTGPNTWDMVKAAIAHLKERSGSSRQKITSYITTNYKVAPDAKFRATLNQILRKRVASGRLVRVKASYKLAPEEKKPKKPKVAKKPKVVKKVKPAKKPAAVKKTAKPKSPKKPKAAAAKPAGAKVLKPKPKVPKKPKAAAKPKATKPKA